MYIFQLSSCYLIYLFFVKCDMSWETPKEGWVGVVQEGGNVHTKHLVKFYQNFIHKQKKKQKHMGL